MTRPSHAELKTLKPEFEMAAVRKEIVSMGYKADQDIITSYWERLVLEVKYQDDVSFPKYFMPDRNIPKKSYVSRPRQQPISKKDKK